MYIISWVGSDWRAASVRQEINSSGIPAILGPEGTGWFITRDLKSILCRELGVIAFADDNDLNLRDVNSAGIYTIPINGEYVHPEGYSNLTQALACEGILYRRPYQDR